MPGRNRALEALQFSRVRTAETQAAKQITEQQPLRSNLCQVLCVTTHFVVF